MRRVRGRGAVAGSTATIMCLNILLALAVSLALPQRAHAVFVADDVAAVAGIAAAAALTYGVVTNTTWANQTGVTDRSTAALYSELSMTGAMGEVGITSASTVAYLMAARAGMVAQGTWDNFCTGANEAQLYGGYLWCSLTGGLYGNLSFQSASQAASAISWPSITNIDQRTAASYWPGAVFNAGTYPAYPVTQSAAQVAFTAWLFALMNAGVHSASQALTYTNGAIKRGSVVLVQMSLVGGTYYYYTPISDPSSWYGLLADMAIPHAGGDAIAGAIDAPAPAATYTDNPDWLPISPAITAANIGTIDANVGAGAIAVPAEPLPWVPPAYLPRAIDIHGIGNDLRGLASEVLGLFGDTWAWLAAPFAGLLTGIAAIVDWLSGITGWLEAWFASIFSPSGTQLSLEFQPRWDDLKTKLDGKWPWAIGPAIGLLAGTIMGGTASGGHELATTWHVTLFKDISFDLNLSTLLDPVVGFRWFLVAMVWVTLGLGLFRLFRPEVVT